MPHLRLLCAAHGYEPPPLLTVAPSYLAPKLRSKTLLRFEPLLRLLFVPPHAPALCCFKPLLRSPFGPQHTPTLCRSIGRDKSKPRAIRCSKLNTTTTPLNPPSPPPLTTLHSFWNWHLRLLFYLLFKLLMDMCMYVFKVFMLSSGISDIRQFWSSF